jgi:N-acetyl-gamma-glutamyl-phosphate reductase
MNQVKVAIVGASGYSGQELIRILMGHPGVDLVCVTSRQHAGKSIAEVHPRFQHHRFADVRFTASDAAGVVASGAKIAFLALPHGLAHEYAKPLLEGGLKIIDLSADFRLKSAAIFEEFYGTVHPAPELLSQSVYGLPEVYRDQIRASSLIASPGCYPTSILLPLVPLLKAGLVEPAGIVVSSMSGVSGSGRKASLDLLYCECNESAHAYGVPKHRHLSEIEQELTNAAGEKVVISFTPHLIPVNRGICSTTYATLKAGVDLEAVTAALEAAYKNEPFVRLQGSTGGADLKNVVFTNFIDIAWRHDPRTGRVVLMSAEDNLVKGASGQAVQSLNLLCGWPETEGLL